MFNFTPQNYPFEIAEISVVRIVAIVDIAGSGMGQFVYPYETGNVQF